MLVVPNSDGYTLNAIDDSLVPPKISERLFHNFSCRYRYLMDELIDELPELQEIVKHIEGISKSWVVKFKGRLLNRLLRMTLLYCDNPQQYGYSSEYIFASSYVYIRHYIRQVVKYLIIRFNLPNKHYRLWLPKQKLMKLSKHYSDVLIPFCISRLPKYHKLLLEYESEAI
jgi:hypothetical protein